MPSAVQSPASRAGVAFELERLDVEDDRILVAGHWSGVRGLRFVRPTLVIDGRAVLATLDHKPWAPDTEPWTAAFPWRGAAIDPGAAQLAVAPRITVPLAGGPAVDETTPGGGAALAAEPPPPEPALAPPAAPRPGSPDGDGVAAELERLQAELRAVTGQRDALRARLEEAETMAAERDERYRRLEKAAGEDRRDAREATQTREDLERDRAAAERDRDRALAQRDEADAARRAAIRSHERMQAELAEAARARQEAERLRDEARTQRDDALAAHRALQRRLDRGMARAERAEDGQAEPAGTAAAAGADDERPLGLRAIPAARAVGAALERPSARGGYEVTRFDLYAIRFFASVAAVSFTLLLVMLVRLFI